MRFRATILRITLAIGLAGLACSLNAADHYVSPTGKRGNGSIEKPWSLDAALRQPRKVKPGDTIWLRGGIYNHPQRMTKFESGLKGKEGAPITVRQYPGERAIINGNITHAIGGWVNYWGIEIMNSLPNRDTPETGPFPRAFFVPDSHGMPSAFAMSGFDLRAPNVKLINCVIHDCIGGGIGLSATASNAEIYGTLSFYNGWQGGDRGHGHGLYGQNTHKKTARIEESLFYANYALGMQATGTGPVVDNFHLEGNIFFHNSVLSRRHQGNLLIGPWEGKAQQITLIRNFIFDPSPSGSDCNLGYEGGIARAVIEGNYFQTPVRFSPNNEGVELRDNVFLADTHFLDQELHPANHFAAATPQTNLVEVRPNRYEPGRAHIIVYNWEYRDSVAVNIKGLLPEGERFEVRSMQNFLGAPVLEGIYDGEPLILPMTPQPVAKPLTVGPPPSTAPAFHAFVLLPKPQPTGAPNSPPRLSAIEDQVLRVNGATTPIPFEVSDPETPDHLLVLSIGSSEPALLPLNRIFLGGSGASRTLMMVPEAGQSGETTVTLSASDGIHAVTRTFRLTVNPGD